MAGVVIAGLFFVALGLAAVFATDTMWRLTQWNSSLRGLESDRNPWWEWKTRGGGVVSMILGVVVIVLAFATS